MAKDLPRYKAVEQFEAQIKRGYAKSLGSAMSEIMKRIKSFEDTKTIKKNASKSKSDKGTVDNS